MTIKNGQPRKIHTRHESGTSPWPDQAAEDAAPLDGADPSETSAAEHGGAWREPDTGNRDERDPAWEEKGRTHVNRKIKGSRITE